MKGIVFTGLLDMVEERYGYELVDELLTENDLPSGGAYTTIGTYDHAEMVTLVVALQKKTGLPIPDLLRTYGHYTFSSFSRSYQMFINQATSAFELLNSVQHYIHVEVRKLYPDAELPQFIIEKMTNDTMVMRYESERKMADFAYGMIEGCLDHFGEKATISMNDLSGDGSSVAFTIQKV
ncbi:MAG: hypothetical protein EOO39_23180 [Cytophagaceae bacterium]|nr:MAG: hypothetical protein EOO39_23180 [Cytophagaceae bacterium]